LKKQNCTDTAGVAGAKAFCSCCIRAVFAVYIRGIRVQALKLQLQLQLSAFRG
jgi:hypothetical protein